MSDYQQFLAAKRLTTQPSGFAVDAGAIHPMLFPFQRAIVRWAVALGRAAVFADTGLGKTFMQAEWARLVAAHTGGRVLLLSPLAVAHQTVREAAKLGIAVTYVRSQAEADAAATPVVITNYDMLGALDPAAFVGVVLDESSILKAFSGATKRQLVAAFASTPYRLACTATPAPNDHMELGNHAEFLGVMQGAEMLARWFINDSMKAESYRLKHHARADFWRWVTSWAVCIAKPSDLGDSDDGFILPPLDLRERIVTVDHTRAHERGQLFVNGSLNATALWKEKAATAGDRCAAAIEIVSAEADEPWMVWCDTNDEQKILEEAFGDRAISVYGSLSVAEKEARISAWLAGERPILITKAEICGYGLNAQHCARHVYVGVTYSFEKFYQALRRSYRFGQTRQVVAYLIYAESEGNVIETIRRKQGDHAAMQAEMTAAQREHSDLSPQAGRFAAPVEEDEAAGEAWRLYLGDCVSSARKVADDSIDFTIFSPPFAELYVYSDSEADMGNCADRDEFFTHFRYLIPELRRITKPGRLCAVHCKDLPTYRNRHGAPGLYDFPGELVRAFEDAGWQFHSRVTIWKDPVIEAARTNNYGLLFGNFTKRAEVTRMGMADYLLVFRRHEEGMPDKQVTQERTPGDFIGTNPPTSYRDDRDYAIQVWQRYASPVWFDIDQTDVLNYQIAKENEDEKHLCPLQLGVIRRAIDLWTNKPAPGQPGEVVFDPFSGVGSAGHVAVQMGRRFVGIELKRAYWNLAQRYLADAERGRAQTSMFDLLEGAPELKDAA